MKLRNDTKDVLRLERFGVPELRPGEECEIADGYALPGLNAQGQRMASVLENLGYGGLVPVNPEDANRFKSEEVRVVARSRAQALVDAGVAPGVAEILADPEPAKVEAEEPSVEVFEEPAAVVIEEEPPPAFDLSDAGDVPPAAEPESKPAPVVVPARRSRRR